MVLPCRDAIDVAFAYRPPEQTGDAHEVAGGWRMVEPQDKACDSTSSHWCDWMSGYCWSLILRVETRSLASKVRLDGALALAALDLISNLGIPVLIQLGLLVGR